MPLRGQLLPGNGQSLRSTEMLGDEILANTIRRSHIVRLLKVRQRSLEILQQAGIPVGDRYAGRASLPDPHQPHRIEAVSGDGIPLCGRYRAQVDIRARLRASSSSQTQVLISYIVG